MTRCSAFVKRFFTPVCDDSPRTNNFNIIRFLAAFLVIYGHMSFLTGNSPALLFFQPVSTVAVKVLFVISGYLVTKSFLSDPDLPRYLVRRSFRIFPALAVVVLLSAFVLGPLVTRLSVAEYFANSRTWEYLSNILLRPVYALPGVFESNPYPNAVNGSLWTLPAEFLTYLLLPPILLIPGKVGSVRLASALATVVTLTLSILYLTVFPGARCVVWGSNLFQMLPLLPYFFVGSLYSLPALRRLLRLQFALPLALIAAIAKTGAAANEVLVFLALPYLTLAFALCEAPIFSRWFAKSDFSYGLYLWGFPVQQLLLYLFPAWIGWGDWRLAWLCFAAALAFAVPSWYLAERPMQRLGQRIVRALRDRRENGGQNGQNKQNIRNRKEEGTPS